MATRRDFYDLVREAPVSEVYPINNGEVTNRVWVLGDNVRYQLFETVRTIRINNSSSEKVIYSIVAPELNHLLDNGDMYVVEIWGDGNLHATKLEPLPDSW